MNDAKLWIGTTFIVGYYATLWAIGFNKIPAGNIELIKDGMLQLGPPVGIIIGALFRSDKVDEIRATNTGKMADAMNAQATSSPTATGRVDDPVHFTDDGTEADR